MTVEAIEAAIATIVRIQDDDEEAHRLEDELHMAVLKAIARDPKDAQKLAAAAIKTEKLKFARWCA